MSAKPLLILASTITPHKEASPIDGKCFFASHPKQGDKIKIDPFDLISGKNIYGSWGGGCKPDKDIPLLATMYNKGKLPLDKLITKIYM